MKITKTQLKKIIAEEIKKVMEGTVADPQLDEFIGPWSKKAKRRRAIEDRERLARMARRDKKDAETRADKSRAHKAEMAAMDDEMKRSEQAAQDKVLAGIAKDKKDDEYKARKSKGKYGDSRIHTAAGGWARDSSLDWDEDISRFEEGS